MQTPRTAATEKTEALANAAKFTTGRAAKRRSLGIRFDLARNRLILKSYLSQNGRRVDFAMIPLQAAAKATKYRRSEPGETRIFFDFAAQNALRHRQPVCVLRGIRIQGSLAGLFNCRQRSICHLNLTHCGDTKSSMRRDVSGIRSSI